MKRIICICTTYFLCMHQRAFAISDSDIGFSDGGPAGSILTSDGNLTPISILIIIQSFLLKVVLPIIVVGASLYIAYELFTAEGDETKLKKAWKSVAYSSIALIAVALSYALVRIISGISF